MCGLRETRTFFLLSCRRSVGRPPCLILAFDRLVRRSEVVVRIIAVARIILSVLREGPAAVGMASFVAQDPKDVPVASPSHVTRAGSALDRSPRSN